MKKFLSVLIASLILLTACGKKEEIPTKLNDNYRNYYEIYVGGFYDSNGDGIGDLKGITQKLSYLNDGDPKTKSDIGIDGIWLMPINPSPTYHKYDVKDYYSIDPQYGTMEDFNELTAACKKAGVDLILDLVLNHTSTQNQWFQSAIQSLAIEPCGKDVCPYPEKCSEHNPFCKFYNFTKQPSGKYYAVPGAGGWYYEAGFWDQMPDLNLDDPNVRQEILKICRFWLDKGVKGFRLDAVIEFYNKNTTKNTEFLKWLTTELQKVKPDVYMVGEAWTSQGIIDQLYQSGIPSFFNYPFSNAEGLIIPAVKTARGQEMAKAFENNQRAIKAANPNAIDAVFLTNHDNARSAGALNRDLSLQKMAAAVYLFAPGNSFIYYGEEIGMTGSGKDENKRQPFIWSLKDKSGMAQPVSGTTQFELPTAGMDEQAKDKNSLLSFYRDAIRLKDLNPEIARGTISAIDLGNPSLCAYKSEFNGKTLYIIHNLDIEAIDISLKNDIFKNVEMRGSIVAKTGNVSIKGNNLNMPSFSTVILREK